MTVRLALTLPRIPSKSSQRGRLGTKISRSLTRSAVHGPLQPPLLATTLPGYFSKEILNLHSARPALVCRNERPDLHSGPPTRNLGRTSHLAWDFEEFDRHINALSRGLLDLGVVKGDRVGVIMGNNSAYACLQWACASIGAILVTLNPAYRLNELVSMLNLVGVRHLFIVPRILAISHLSMLADAFPALCSSPPGGIQEPKLVQLHNLVILDDKNELQRDLARLNVKCAIDWREILVWSKSKDLLDKISRSLDHEDVINLQFTSGTTGLPKAVSLTHSNLLNNALSIARYMRLTPKDILCNVPPLFHCFDDLVLGNLAAWSHGACIVYPSEVFNPKRIVDAVVQEKCTALHGVPTHFLGVLAEVERRNQLGERVDTNNLRTGIAAGSPIPIDLMKQLIAKLNLTDLTVAYGMTETSPVSFQTTPTDPIIKRVETVGKVHPHVKAKLIDSLGNIVPVGTPGEICIAGYLLQKGYWEDEEQTQKVMRRDEAGTLWMHTGDEGIMDQEGYLRVVGRIKDIIIRGGENLFPVQIENVLTAHPDIREAAVVAVPDPRYGEVVGAWIVREPGKHISGVEVRNCVALKMNPQNAPEWVWFVGDQGTSEDLPKTASGKVMKHVLRERSRELAVKNIGLARVTI